MACHSGYLTDALRGVSAAWQGRSLAGRNLSVLASVAADQLSDASEDPAIGNAFTYAVTTALRGAADGFGGKTADGRVDMEELKTYVISTAHDPSTGQQHSPRFAGEYVSSEVFAASPR